MILHVRLIAAREVIENLRTKGFWLTVIAPPLIMTITAMLPLLWRTSTPTLEFAVVDQSGWLAAAVRERSDAADIAQVLDGLAFGRALALPGALKSLPELAQRLSAEQRHALARQRGDGAGANQTSAHEQTSAAARAPSMAVWPDQLPWQLRHWWRHTATSELPDWLQQTARARFRWQDARGQDQRQLRDAVRGGQLFGFFVLPAEPLANDASVRFVSLNLTNPDLANWFERLANDALRERRMLDEHLAPATLARINAPLRLQTVAINKDEAALATRGDLVAQWAPAILAYFLWISVFAVSQMLLTSTVEEKSSKLADVLLASVTADDLLAGKVIGIALTGFAVLGAWLTMGAGAIALLPAESPLQPQDFAALAQPVYWLSFIVYFLLGYLLLATTIAGLGALTNSLRDAQNLMFPLQMLLMVPLATIIPISRDPNGSLSALLTWVPPFTPFVMVNRAAQPPDAWVYTGTVGLLLVCIWAAWRLASRLFRVGMLMGAGTPGLRELAGLLRYRS